MSLIKMRKYASLFLTTALILSAQQPPAPPAAGQQPPAQQGRGGGGRGPQNLMVLPSNTTQQQLLPTMEMFEVSLGVQCTFCHVQGNFASDDNMRKNAARAMMRIVDDFNKKFPDGKARIGCWTCHRGVSKPEMTPPANLLEEAAKAVAANQGGRGGGGAAPAAPPQQ